LGLNEMPKVSTGIIRLKYVVDKIKRELLVEGYDTSVIGEAISELEKLVKEKMLEKGLTDDDVVDVSLEYDVSNGKIAWKAETLKIVIYKPIEEVVSVKKELEELRSKNKELNEKVEKIREVLRELSDRISKLLSEI